MLVLDVDAGYERRLIARMQPIGEHTAVAPNRDRTVGGLADEGGRPAQTAILDQVTPEFAKFMLSKIPMGRFVKVEEIAAMACWLASEDCSFSTGGVFDISGGRATY